MSDKWLPSALVVALIGAMFYVLHTDFTRLQPPSPSGRKAGDVPNAIAQQSENHSGGPITSQDQHRSDSYADHGQQKPPPDWWLNSGLILVGIAQLLVFGEQARQLRKSIDLTRTIAERQEKDMRDSIKEAARGAAAAMKSAEVAERSLHATQRAFITVLGTQHAPMGEEGNATGWSFRVEFKNIGPTVANNVQIAITGTVLSSSTDEFDTDNIPWEGPRVDVGPQVDLFSESIGAQMELIKAVQNGDRAFFVWGGMRYSDVFDNQHRINFCFELKVLMDPSIVPGPGKPSPFLLRPARRNTSN